MSNTKNSQPREDKTNQTDFTRRPGLGCSIGAGLLIAGVVAGSLLLFSRFFTQLSMGDVAGQVAPETEGQGILAQDEPLTTRLATATELLNGYGWIDQVENRARIPIARAMDLLSSDSGNSLLATLTSGSFSALEAESTDESTSPSVVDPVPTASADNAVANQAETSEPNVESNNQDSNIQDVAAEPSLVTFDMIQPIMELRCGECHGEEDPDEGLVVTTYAGIIAGSDFGSVIKRGDPANSYLVDQIVTGKMPKRADDLPQNEIDLIVAWIQDGALEGDGSIASQPQAASTLTPTVAPTIASELTVTAPISVADALTAPITSLISPTVAISETDVVTTSLAESTAITDSNVLTTAVDVELTEVPISETVPLAGSAVVDLANVSFKMDVLPIFEVRCGECHSDDDPGEGLVVTSYAGVKAGSDFGSVIKPGDPENSYLVDQIITGKMPKRADDLPQNEVDIIVAWIRNGALDN